MLNSHEKLSMNIPTDAQEKIKLSRPFIKEIAVIGAGLGGLAVAVALRKLGFNVQVYEKAQDFRPVGAGFGLFPNGLNFLEAIEPGIVETIKKSGCEVSKTVVKNTQGEIIRTNPGSRYKDKYGQPLISVWWWRLQQILASLLPPESIHLNHRCIGFEQDEQCVSIYFENGKQVKADLLIGADGINSAVREALIGDGKPRYLNSLSWRAVINFPQKVINPGEIGFVKGNQGFMFLINVGDEYISWVYRQLSADFSLSQNPTESKSRVLEQLADWEKSLRALVEATSSAQIVQTPICDRLPLNSWSYGRVTLLGDAAHPMSPSIGQGANSTFEDAYQLALCCSQASTLQEALTAYEQIRVPRTHLLQTRSALSERSYYATDRQAFEQQMQEASQMSSEEFENWLYSYKPKRNLIE